MNWLPHDGETRDISRAFAPSKRQGTHRAALAGRYSSGVAAAEQKTGLIHPGARMFGKPRDAAPQWAGAAAQQPQSQPQPQRGGDPRASFTPIHQLILDGKAAELLEALVRVRGGADGERSLAAQLAAEDDGGCTPLMRAAFTGSVPVVRALLAFGADAGAVSTKTQRTALHEAASATHDNPSLGGLLLGAGCDPERRALVNGRTALEITRLKIGPDGHVGSSAMTAQLGPLVRANHYQAMDRSGIWIYEAEVAALRHIVTVVGLVRGLQKHAELMASVAALHIDLYAMLQQYGVENAVGTAFEHIEAHQGAQALAGAGAPGAAPKQQPPAASLVPGTVIYVVGKGRGVYRGGASQLSAAEMAGSGEFGAGSSNNYVVEYANGITQEVILDRAEWSVVSDHNRPAPLGPVRPATGDVLSATQQLRYRGGPLEAVAADGAQQHQQQGVSFGGADVIEISSSRTPTEEASSVSVSLAGDSLDEFHQVHSPRQHQYQQQQ